MNLLKKSSLAASLILLNFCTTKGKTNSSAAIEDKNSVENNKPDEKPSEPVAKNDAPPQEVIDAAEKAVKPLAPETLVKKYSKDFFVLLPVGTQTRIPVLFKGQNAYCILVPSSNGEKLVPLKSNAFARHQIVDSLKIHEDRLVTLTTGAAFLGASLYLAYNLFNVAAKDRRRVDYFADLFHLFRKDEVVNAAKKSAPILVGGIFAAGTIKTISWLGADNTFSISEKDGSDILKTKKKWNEGDYKNALWELQKITPATNINCIGE